MDLKISFLAFHLTLLLGVATSATFISDGAFQSQVSIGRNLLQAKKNCPVSFEFANYTTILSKCKGPNYPVDKCCPAFKEFACPYADYINDGTNNCADTMFTYITTKGNYPAGLFGSECREGKDGLACPADAQNSTDNANAGHVARSFVPVSTLVSGFLLAFLSS